MSTEQGMTREAVWEDVVDAMRAKKTPENHETMESKRQWRYRNLTLYGHDEA